MSDRARDAEPGRVVVGIDTSLSGLQALRQAVAQARLRRVALHAVRAWGPAPADQLAQDTTWQPALGMVQEPSGTPAGSQADVPGTSQVGRPAPAAAAAAIVDRAFADTMGGEPIDLSVRTVLVPDQPGPVLVEYACRDSDLLVLGSGRRRFPARHYGSRVVRYCLRRASCPVLVVPPPPLSRAGSVRSLLRELRRELDQLTDHGITRP